MSLPDDVWLMILYCLRTRSSCHARVVRRLRKVFRKFQVEPSEVVPLSITIVLTSALFLAHTLGWYTPNARNHANKHMAMVARRCLSQATLLASSVKVLVMGGMKSYHNHFQSWGCVALLLVARPSYPVTWVLLNHLIPVTRAARLLGRTLHHTRQH